MDGVADTDLRRAAAIVKRGMNSPFVGHSLRTDFAADDDGLDVGVVLGLVAGEDARRGDDDVDDFHEGDPFLGGVGAEAECAAVVERTEDFPGAHVEGDVEELGDAQTGAHADVARGASDDWESEKGK